MIWLIVGIGYIAVACAVAWVAGRFGSNGEFESALAAITWPVSLPVIAVAYVVVGLTLIAEHARKPRKDTP